MAIRKTSAGTYEARWRPPGARDVRSKRFKTKREAVGFMAKIESSKRDGTYTDLTRGKQTLDDWWREYFAHSVALRPSTREHYRRLAELHILPHLGRRAVGPSPSPKSKPGSPSSKPTKWGRQPSMPRTVF